MLQLQHCSAHWKSAVMLGYAKKYCYTEIRHSHNS
jgi:hypothetical protein